MHKVSLCALLISATAFAQKKKADFFEYENPYEEKAAAATSPASAAPAPKPLPPPSVQPAPKPLPAPSPTATAAPTPTPKPQPTPRAPTLTKPEPLQLKSPIVTTTVPLPAEPVPSHTSPAPSPVLRSPIVTTTVEKKSAPEEKKAEKKSEPETLDAPVAAAATHGSGSESSSPTASKTSEPDPKLPLEQRIRFRGEGPSANWWNGITSAPRGMEFGSVPDPNNASTRRNGVLVTRKNGTRYFFMNTGYRAATRGIAADICKKLSPKGRWKLVNGRMKLPLAAFQAERDGLSGGDETMWIDDNAYLVSILGFADPTDRVKNGKKVEGLFVAPVNYGGGNLANTQSGAAAVTSAYRGKYDLYARGGGRVFCATGDTASGY